MRYNSARKKNQTQGLQTKNSNFKSQQKYIQTLMQDVHQSRIAVEHIDYSKKDQHLQSNNVEVVKNQLKGCVVQINTQEKRQRVLKELVSLLKGEMTKIEAKELEIKEKEEAELDKALRELEQDIDKISQKKNQQVAKIAILKQNANQNRSERVVYSNLFKKLEKQLKQHQEMYKSQLLRAEKTKYDLEISTNKKSKNWLEEENKCNNNSGMMNSTVSKGFQHQYSISVGSTPIREHKNSVSYNKAERKSANDNKNNEDDDFWLTSVSKNDKIREQSNLKIPRMSRVSEKEVSNKGKILASGKIKRLGSSKHNIQNFSSAMEELRQFNERIKLITGCESVEQIVRLFDSIQGKNESLQAQIDEMEDKIQYYEKEAMKIYKNKDQLANMSVHQSDEFQVNMSRIHLTKNNSKKSHLFHLYKNGKENLLTASNNSNVYNSRTKNMIQSSMLSQKQEGEKNQEEVTQQFLVLCNFLNNINEENKENLSNINPISMSSSQLEQKCKDIDAVVSELWQNISSYDKQLKENKFYTDNQGNYLKIYESNDPNNDGFEKYNNTEESRLKIGSQDNRRESSSFINAILNRMDKFGNCEKLLDKEGFYGEYRKEMNRKTKARTKKN